MRIPPPPVKMQIHRFAPTDPDPAPRKPERSYRFDTPNKRFDMSAAEVLRTIHRAPRSH